MTPVRKLLAFCAALGFLVFPCAEASEGLSHDIAAQPLTQALNEFASQTGLQFVYVSEIAATQASKGAPRGLAAPDALRRLLAGTGLHFEFLNDRTVRIFAGPPSGADALATKGPYRLRSPVDSLEEVIVHGPRWWLDPTEAVAPVIVLDRRDIERGGANSIGDVLQSLPMTTGSPFNTNVNTGQGAAEPRTHGTAGEGSVRIFLHDLPTLVLLNGRRLPSSGLGADASVDLNTLPISFIERVEVMTGGASAAFGADAVGGVVNIVTQRNDRGLELSGTRTITQRGDGEILSGQAAIGFELLGGTWGLGLDYVEQDGVTMDRRSYSASPLLIVDSNGTVAARGLNNMPADGGFVVPEGNALGLEPGGYTRVAGATGQTPADYRPYVRDEDGFNIAPYSYSQTPNERISLWLLGSRPLGESTTIFLEGLAHHRESAQHTAPPYYVGRATADNFYNPFRVDLRIANRRLVEAGNRVSEQEVDLWRTLIGLEGSVARWTWEVALQSAKSEATSIEHGFIALSRLAPALGPSGPDISGRVVCGSPDPVTGLVPAVSIIPGCVPLNLFGGAGSITEEQLAYVIPGAQTNRGTNEQQLAQFVLSGSGGRLLGRNLEWVLGADYRREAGSLTPDPNNGLEFVHFRSRPDLSGDYDVREVFTAVQVPLLHDRPWARDMALNLGLRWSDFSSFDSHTTWQAGLRWQPAEELALRASYAEVFRLPSFAELYSPQTHIEHFEFDEPITLFAGGNPELEPETGHSIGAGLVYAPAWAKGLSASVDYFQVELADYIWQASPDQVLFECAERSIRSACEAIRRTPDGRVLQVSTINDNWGMLDVRGFDFAINWVIVTRLGDVNSSLLATHLERWDWHPIPGGEVYPRGGNFNAGARPRWRASGHLDWRSGPWMASYAAEYIGSYTEWVEPWPSFGADFEPFNRRVDPVLYHDLEGGYRFDSGVTVRAAITNVTDEDPPYLNIAPANTDVATYRLLGRSYFLELRYQVKQ